MQTVKIDINQIVILYRKVVTECPMATRTLYVLEPGLDTTGRRRPRQIGDLPVDQPDHTSIARAVAVDKFCPLINCLVTTASLPGNAENRFIALMALKLCARQIQRSAMAGRST